MDIPVHLRQMSVGYGGPHSEIFDSNGDFDKSRLCKFGLQRLIHLQVCIFKRDRVHSGCKGVGVQGC